MRKMKSAAKKYERIHDEFLLPPGCEIVKATEAKSKAFAIDMSTIKHNSKGPGEFFRICRVYLRKRPKLVTHLEADSATELAHKFTIVTIVEQEFQVCLEKYSISSDAVEMSLNDEEDGMGLTVAVSKSKVPSVKAEMFSKELSARLDNYLKDITRGNVRCKESPDGEFNNESDEDDISEFIENIQIDDIQGEA